MEYIVFVAYLVLIAWLVTKIRFFTKTGLSRPQLVILFLLKIIAGIFYGWIGLYYGGLAQMQDTWAYHTYGVQEYHLLFNNPHEYFTNLFRNPYGSGMDKFLSTSDSYWNDLKGNVFVKILSAFDVLSFGYYYVNVLFYSFITLFGPVAMYRVMMDIFPGKKWVILISTFMVPSFLYWTSGIHKEGMIFTGISLVVYALYFANKEKKFGIKRIIMLAIGLLLILFLRNFLILLIVPAVLTLLLAYRWPKRGLAIFGGMYLLFILIFFNARHINPKLDFPQAVVNRQQDFIKLVGNSTIPIEELKPTAASFLENTPQAINLSAIRPYPGDVKHLLSLAAAIEINILLLLFVLFILKRKNGYQDKNIIWFCLFFSFTVLLAIGFSVNNLGAIVRYRSIILPLLVIPMAARIDWAAVGGFLNNNIKKSNNS